MSQGIPAETQSRSLHTHSSGTSTPMRIDPPRAKSELIAALDESRPKRIGVFEGINLACLPSRLDL